MRAGRQHELGGTQQQPYICRKGRDLRSVRAGKPAPHRRPHAWHTGGAGAQPVAAPGLRIGGAVGL